MTGPTAAPIGRARRHERFPAPEHLQSGRFPVDPHEVILGVRRELGEPDAWPAPAR